MKRLLSKARARLPKIRARRPLTLSLAAALLVALVGVTVLWQVRAHASPTRVPGIPVVSDVGDPYTTDDPNNSAGTAVYTYGHAGCPALDSNNSCMGADLGSGFIPAVWPNITGAHWIWETQLPQASQDNFPVTLYKTFSIPANATNLAGTIQITADNAFDLQVNDVGSLGGVTWSGTDFRTINTFSLDSVLHTGQNTIKVKTTNTCCFDPNHPLGNPGGLIYRIDYSYVPDNTAPTTTAIPSSLPNSNGWYNSSVTLTLQATDPDDDASTLSTNYSMDGGAWQTYSSPLMFTQDGQHTLAYYSTDPAGNVEATKTATINLDQTPPDLHVSGPASGTSYSFCTGTIPTRPTFAPTDNLSGLDGAQGAQGDSWTTPTSATGAGAYTYTAHARDMAGNPAQETRTYTVAYGSAFGGVLSPVSTDGSSSFHLGSTIPVKFQLLCNGVPVSNAVASLRVSQNGSSQNGSAPGKAISTSAATTGNLFRYDSTGQQYIFNLSTKDGYTRADGSKATYTAGTWTLTIVLDDGSSHAYTIALN